MEKKGFLIFLRRCRPRMSAKEYRCIKGQYLAGDLEGAWRGLLRILGRKTGGSVSEKRQ